MNALVLNPKFKGLPGYYVFVVAAGGNWPTDAIDSYQDSACTVPNTNPVMLDSNGEAMIFVKQSYKLIYARSSPTLPTWTEDYLNVLQETVILGSTTVGTVDNLYYVTSSPAQSAYYDQMMLIMTPDVDSQSTMGTQTFTGTGENDAIFSGPYTGSTSGSVFTVQIDANGTPDTFQWKKDGGAWTTGVPITGATQILIEGVTVKFARTTGHTVNDLWAVTVQVPVEIDLDALGAKIVYKNVEGSGLIALGSGDLKANFPVQLLYSVSQSAWVLINQAAPSLTSPAPNRVRREVVGPYSVTLDDAGNEVAVTTGPVQLPTAASFANQFVYLQGMGGSVAINSDGTEKIYLPDDLVGTTTIYVGGGIFDTIQLQSDSIGWHILTSVPRQRWQILDGTDWLCPMDVSQIFVSGCGGGRGGTSSGGDGGSKGKEIVKYPYTVTPGDTYANAIGTGGAGGNPPDDGGDTTFGTDITLTGGSTTSSSPTGEDSLFGFGGTVGNDATGHGAGGGGGSAPSQPGGAGSLGYLLLEW